MIRIINSSNRVLAQRSIRWTLNFTRTVGNDAEAGSVASGNDAFSKREHAEEARWARRHDAEQIAKYRTEHPSGNQQGTPQQRLAALEAEKRRVEQEIAELKRQKHCYLQIRRGKQTIFTDVSETTTLAELKQIIANILKINPDIIRILSKGTILDIDSKHLLEYGITTKESRPQTPYQLEFILQLDDGTYETEDIIPYTSENNSGSDEIQQIGGLSNDSK